MNIRRISTLAMAGALLVRAQQPADSGAVIHTESRVVLVDAVVTDKKGAYVHDLTAKDFKVQEDGKEQTITSFSFASDPASPLSQGPRYIVLYFDDSAMSPSTQPFARRAAAQFIDANAGPNRLMAIANYGGTLQIAQNFTADADRLRAVVNNIHFSSASTNRGIGVNLERRESILALRGMARTLARIRGRKTLILITSGFAMNREMTDEVNTTIEVLNRSNVAVYPIDVRGVDAQSEEAPVSASSSASPRMPGSMAGSARNTRMQQDGGNPAINQQLMTMFADGTGGFSLLNSNNLEGGMQRIASELNEYYLIGYTPPDSKEGSCHKLKVKLDRGGVNVRARNGYCDAKPEEITENPAQKTLENRAAEAQPGNLAATVQMPFFYTAPNVARVNFAMEIAPESIKFQNDKGKFHAAINILGIGTKPDGSVGARFSDLVNLDFETAAEVDQFKQKPFHYENQFGIAAGTYQMKVVFSSGGDNFGKIEQPLVVDAYEGKAVTISPLMFSTIYGHLAPGETGTGTALLEDRTPLVAGGVRLAPAGTNKFAAVQKPLVYFEVYEPALMLPKSDKPVMVAVQIRIFDRTSGAQIVDLGGVRLPIPEKPTSPMIPWGATIPVQQLKPGAYRVVVNAIDSMGGNITRAAEFVLE
jgi:VWFA-related protein